MLDGVRINRYACSSELRLSANNQPAIASIGTFCHEYAHTLGLPDLYDTDYQVGGLGAGTWRRVSLMDGGNYNNDGNTPPNFTAVDRDVLGLNAPQLLEMPETILSNLFTMDNISRLPLRLLENISFLNAANPMGGTDSSVVRVC